MVVCREASAPVGDLAWVRRLRKVALSAHAASAVVAKLANSVLVLHVYTSLNRKNEPV